MKPEIKKRIEQIKNGKIPKGYKKTKVGIIPNDWIEKKINDWIELKERNISLEDENIYKLVTVRRSFSGVDYRGSYKGKDILVKNYIKVHENDFLISKRQIAHGACGIVPKFLNNAVVSNEYNVFEAKNNTDIKMFNLIMQLPYYKRLFYLMSDGVHIEKLLFKTNHWLKQKLVMPPIEEQQKIAEILTAQDKLIELKEKLITEKERQKKYLMQQLLTGKKRLKDFSCEWKKVKLGEICDIIKGEQLNKNTLNDTGKYYVLNGGITPSGFTNNWNTEANIISISEGGNSCGFVNYNIEKFWSGGHCYTLQNLSKSITTLYLYSYLKAYEYIIMSLRVGSGLPNIQKNSILKFKILLPPLDEQNAIAEILSKADKEIELLKQDLEQEKLKKKALMQLLLTGIVRV